MLLLLLHPLSMQAKWLKFWSQLIKLNMEYVTYPNFIALITEICIIAIVKEDLDQKYTFHMFVYNGFKHFKVLRGQRLE